jgi:polygalacturonase
MKNLLLIIPSILMIVNQMVAKDYNVLDYRAEKGKLSTAAIQKTVDLCAADGGGRVIVPASAFITGITIKDTPVWATRFGYCDNVSIQGVTIRNNLLVPNSDGIHCKASRNIRISECDIVAGDDCIVLTGFTFDEEIPGYKPYEQAAHQYGNKSIYGENMVVTNCILQSSSAAIRIGYGQHPIRRCTFSNIVIHDSHRGEILLDIV